MDWVAVATQDEGTEVTCHLPLVPQMTSGLPPREQAAELSLDGHVAHLWFRLYRAALGHHHGSGFSLTRAEGCAAHGKATREQGGGFH